MKNLFGQIKGIGVVRSEPLRRHTYFKIGGKADYFIRVYSIKALHEVLAIVRKQRLRYFVIGAGTNLLVQDRGFSGVVIKLAGTFRRIKRQGNRFACGGGVLLKNLLNRAYKNGYGGCEFMAGIPGTVGGAIKGNAGAFGQSVADITERITVVHGTLEKDLENKKIGFTYRNSELTNGTIILSAQIRLTKGRADHISKLIKKNLQHRAQSQPTGYSAGSFFRNPPGDTAGRLIETCGLKGLRIGDAMVSNKHANFIMNLGTAKAADVMKLAKVVRKVVRERTGIRLEQEVKLLG